MRSLLSGNQRFANTMHRRSVAGGILAIVGDADAHVFYFATATIIYPPFLSAPDTAVRLDGIIADVSPVKTSIDIASMTSEIANCTMTLSALPREKTHDSADKWRCVTDDLWKSQGQGASVWLFPGGPLPPENFSSLLDLIQYVALNVGYFRIADINMQDLASIVVELTEWDVSTLRRTVFLPQRKFTRADFPAIEEDRIGVTMPLVWGADSINPHLGVIGAYCPIQRVSNDTWLVSDHEEYICADKITPVGNLVVCIQQLDALATCIYDASYVDFLNSGGRAYVHVLDMYNLQFRVSISPTRAYSDSAVADQGSTLAWDGDLETSAPVVADANNHAAIYFEWAQEGVSEESATLNAIGEIVKDGATPSVCRSAQLWLYAEALLSSITSSELDVWMGAAWVTFKTNPLPPGSLVCVDSAFKFDNGATPPTYDWTGAHGTFWHLASGPHGTGDDGHPFKCRLVLHNTSNNWTVGATIATVDEVRLQIDAKGVLQKYQPTFASGGTPRTKGRGRLRTRRIGLWGVDTREYPGWMNNGPTGAVDFGDTGVGFRPYGRMFGSWIAGRSDDPAIQEEMAIINSQYIIESILRDELGYLDAQIDMPSFDAIPTDRIHAVWLPAGSKIGAVDLIDQICYEAGLILIYASGGKWKLLRYDSAAMSSSPQFTVFPDDLIGMAPILSQTPVDQIRNDATVNYYPSTFEGTYKRKRTYTDSASVTKFGTVDDSFELSTVLSDTGAVDAFGDRMIGTDGILSRVHGRILLQTVGWKFAHVEIGDRGTLDPSMDYHRLYFGRSWTARTFLVVDVAIGLDQVDIELYDPLELFTP